MHKLKFTLALTIALLLTACNATKHVPQGEYLLNSVDIQFTDNPGISKLELINYLRQQPNHTVLGFAKLSLGVYNLSGMDSTKWYNKWMQKLGQEPVIFNRELTDASRRQLTTALINRGYNDVVVEVDSAINNETRRADIVYRITAGQPHTIGSIAYEIADPAIAPDVLADSARSTIRPGMLLNRDFLENERTQITSRLRDKGYYAFSKDFISFIADTVAGSKEVDLTIVVQQAEIAAPTSDNPNRKLPESHRKYIVERVKFLVEPGEGTEDTTADTISRPGYQFIYGGDEYLRPGFLEEKCFITPGQSFNGSDVTRTYEALSRLSIVKYVNITMEPLGEIDSTDYLEAVVKISRDKKQNITFEVEGTNSEGDLGFGVGLGYQHRDLFHGAETLNARINASYESLSGNLDGFINDRYTEVGTEIGLNFPKFKAPFLSRQFKRKVKATTELALSFNYQERPEYTRFISGLAWKYHWNSPRNTWRHTFDLIDVNMVYLPHSTENFINNIAPQNPLLRYSYEDHLIVRMGYSFYRSNRRTSSTSKLAPQSIQPRIWTLRVAGETAGNALYAISSLFGQHRHDGVYKVLGVQYAQYVKGDVSFSYLWNLSQRSSFAVHGEFGIVVPYGNSSMVPFEKRFYAGGANSVRGWSVRSLGPGAYDARNSVIDFINQCGDISMEFSAEYRAKLFWVIEGALFVDAGNIWTIRNYETQPGGVFRFNKFYKQIALSYGAGLRFDFTYFLLRFDLGMKAHNPAMNSQPWPIVHPKWGRDHAFHLAIGYPF